MKQIVFITRGLPASGKTTWSREYVKRHMNFKRINRDDLRMMIYDNQWTKRREEAVLLARRVLIENFLNEGYNLVLDDTNLIPERLRETVDIIKRFDEHVIIKIKDFTHVPLEVCIQRNSKRPDKIRVPEKFIRDYWRKYISSEKYG